MITDIQDGPGKALAQEILAAGGKAEYLHHDVTDEQAWVDVMCAVKQRNGGLNILVNNAGIGIAGSIVDMTLADWQRQQAINLDGVFLGIKHSIPLMRESGSGSIINLSSVAGPADVAGRAVGST